MKQILLSAAAFVAMLQASANDVQLIVQRMGEPSSVGTTYRVYAQVSDANHHVHVVYGDQQHPLNIQSTAPFYQNQYGGYSAAGMHEALLGTDSQLAHDSWITVGYQNHESNDMWDIGVDFSAFDAQGGQISTQNGGWFLIPTDEKCAPNAQGLVLIAQLTSTGKITGTLNLQGSSQEGVWRSEGLTFSTDDARVFGCTDAQAANYSPAANFNDGTCQGSCISNGPAVGASNTWDVFPNPLRSGLINIQFNQMDITKASRIEIVDMNGRLISSHVVNAAQMMNGNRLTIDQELSAGTYKVVLQSASGSESKTIVVQK
ncbi:MAG: T9SS type A sorting domain-containing protein [Flavobacteriales bacterium]